MSTASPPRKTNADWLVFIQQIQAKLQQTLDATDQAAVDLHSGGGKMIGDRREYEWAILTTKFNQLNDRIQRAESLVTTVEESMLASEQTLQQYQSKSRLIREKLAAWSQSKR